MARDLAINKETDPRFPSGKWLGFYLMAQTGAQKHQTELMLTFADGRMQGDGRDKVGDFVCDGRYDLADGKCVWIKRYVGKHDVYYQGYNEGKGIWGVWSIPPFKGGFHIWPEDFGEPSDDALHEEAEVPADADPVLMPV